MLIRFRCRHCKKTLGVKPEMAGKRAKCPACKKPILIPVPAPAVKPAVDIEALAAAALADDVDPQAAPAPTSIDFSCQFCGEAVSMALDMGGKREPCPSCRRIIRIPMPEIKKDDWRTIKQTGPSGALINQQEKLEGEWGTQTAKGSVSKDALVEADAMPIFEPDEPPGVWRWLKRAAIFSLVIGLVVAAVLGFNRSQRAKSLQTSIETALAYMDQKDIDPKDKLPLLWMAELHRGVGEYYIRKGDLAKAKEHLIIARGFIPYLKGRTMPSLDNDLFLLQLVDDQIALGGTEDDKKEKKAITWDDMPDQLQGTLNRINSQFVRAKALRMINSRLKQLAQDEVAISLATRFLPGIKSKESKTSPMLAQFIAALLERNQDDIANKRVPPPTAGKGIPDLVPRLGYAEGFARQGRLPEAQELISVNKYPGFPIDRLRTAIAVADVVLATPDADAKPVMDDALKLCGELRGQVPEWEVLQMIDLLARTEDLKGAEQLSSILDKKVQPWAEYAILTAKLEKLRKERTKAEPEMAQQIKQADSLPRALAWEQISRHNTELGYRQVLKPALDFPQNKRSLPLIHLGIALGEQDRER